MIRRMLGDILSLEPVTKAPPTGWYCRNQKLKDKHSLRGDVVAGVLDRLCIRPRGEEVAMPWNPLGDKTNVTGTHLKKLNPHTVKSFQKLNIFN